MKWLGKINFDNRPQYDAEGLITESEVDTISGTLSSEIDSDISTHASNTDAHHSESHTVVSHSDTTATGANLNELVGAGDTSLHKHDGQYYTESEVDTWRNSTTQTEMGYVNGVTSDIQTQLDTKLENVVEDETPQLYADLDGQGNYLVNVQNIPDLAAKGSGYWFDGVNDYINLDTLAAELVDTSNTEGTIVWKGQIHDFTSGSKVLWGFGDTNGNEYVWCRTSATAYKLNIRCRIAGTTQWDLETDNTFSENTEYEIVVVHDGTSPVLYVNGKLESITFLDSTDLTAWFADTTSIDNGRLGCVNYLSSGNIYFLNCSVSKFYALNNCPTATEVKALSSGAPVPYKYLGASQTDCLSGWDFTSGWIATSSASIDDINSFTTTVGARGIYLSDSLIVGKKYKLIITGTTSVGLVALRCIDGASVDIDSDILSGGGSTVEFTAEKTGLYLRNADISTTDITTLELTRIGCVLQLEQDGITDTKWFDKSGNSLDGSVSGAVAINTVQQITLPQVNDAANPTLAFGDGDSGFYEAWDDTLGMSFGGALKLYFSEDGVRGSENNSFWILNITSTDVVPSLAPNKSDQDTGIGHAGDDQLSLIAGGVEGIRITENGTCITNIKSPSALTNTVLNVAKITHITSGTPAAGIGVGIEFEQETTADNNEVIATIEAIATDVTGVAEDGAIVFKTMKSGTTATEKMRVDSDGNLTVSGTVSASDGSLSVPSYSFSNNPDTGFYLNAISQVEMSHNGTFSFRASDAGIVAVSYRVGTTGVSYEVIGSNRDLSANDGVFDGNISVVGTVDGIDIATFKSDYDSHDHDDRYYTESEVDTISGSLNTKIAAKPDTLLELSDTPAAYDEDKYLKSTIDGTEWATVSGGTGTSVHSELSNLDYASAGHTGQLSIGENDIKLDALLSADGKYSGTTRDGVLGATLAFGDLVYLNTTDQRWELADADAETTSGDVDLAIVLAAGNDGDTRLLLIDGFVREDDWNFTSYGQNLFVSTTAGDMTQTAPGSGKIVRIVGKAGTTANEIRFKPSGSWVEKS